jgi:ATP-dependent Clp protease adaptor protein ClpS
MKAIEITTTAHLKGLCVVALTTREVADTKASQAMDMAAQVGFPLKFTIEPEV